MPRWLKFIALLLLALVVAVVSLPWWIGPAATPVLRRQGITLINPSPEGFRALGVQQVRVVRGNTTVMVHDLRLASPLQWLSPAHREASAGQWSVIVTASATPTPPKPGS